MKPLCAILTLALLAACGADGEPVQPAADASVTLSRSDVYADITLGLRQAPLGINLGINQGIGL